MFLRDFFKIWYIRYFERRVTFLSKWQRKHFRYAHAWRFWRGAMGLWIQEWLVTLPKTIGIPLTSWHERCLADKIGTMNYGTFNEYKVAFWVLVQIALPFTVVINQQLTSSQPTRKNQGIPFLWLLDTSQNWHNALLTIYFWLKL